MSTASQNFCKYLTSLSPLGGAGYGQWLWEGGGGVDDHHQETEVEQEDVDLKEPAALWGPWQDWHCDCGGNEDDAHAGNNLTPLHESADFWSVMVELKSMTLLHSCSKMSLFQKDRDIDPEAVKAEDFDCSLCFRLLWQPITTPCGHTYCR